VARPSQHLSHSLGKGDRGDGTGAWTSAAGRPEGEKRSVTEIEADEVGASLKRATAKVERSASRGNSDRSRGREREAGRGGDFNNAPPSE
jgi:single-strand DNA-binding protein